MLRVTNLAGTAGLIGIGFFLAVNGWKFYKAGGVKKVVSVAQKAVGPVTKARVWLKERL